MANDLNASSVSTLIFQEPQPAAGWEPVGEGAVGDLLEAAGPAAADIPQTIADLEGLVSTIYDLTATRAGELKIPIAGSVGGGTSRRVVISEYSQTKLVTDASGIELRYGYALRFCLTVNKWNVDAKLSLPFLSAQAEIGQIEAGWTMQVIGLNGPKIRAAVLPPKPLSVETFVIAQQSLEKIIEAINDPTTQFIPGVVVSTNDPKAPGVVLRRSVVQAFALYRLFKSNSVNQAIAELGSVSGSDNDIITDTYSSLGIGSPNDIPPSNARTAAQAFLGGLKVSG
ncbi:MAG: hypothetical protein QOH86_1946 [Sphingomonadales bacterium]|jgi:hypothetical protein|nr:hypothetical protein [Sphingomonadales bacterium]